MKFSIGMKQHAGCEGTKLLKLGSCHMGIDEEKHHSSEVRMLMRHPQYRRYVCSLPNFSVDPDLPEPFVRLLCELDRVSEELEEKRRG